MLLQLPKEILSHILSLLVHDELVRVYGWFPKHPDEYRFFREYSRSFMSPYMKSLSTIHPKIRRILQSVTRLTPDPPVYQKNWSFDVRFFRFVGK